MIHSDYPFYSPSPQIQWYKDWKPLKTDKRVRILWREPDTSILLINGCLNPRDGGLYSVTATTPAGTTTASVRRALLAHVYCKADVHLC